MNLFEADLKLSQLNQSIFTTQDAVALFHQSLATTSMTLLRLSRSGRLARLAKGKWAIPDKTDPLSTPEHLTAPWPSYISLQTALFRHGMISQIPVVTYAVSLGRTQKKTTQLGTFSIHHLQPDFFFGYETIGKSMVKLATPEKALLDVLYLSPTKSRLFHSLPEVELSRRFSIKKAREIIQKIPSLARRALVLSQFNAILSSDLTS